MSGAVAILRAADGSSLLLQTRADLVKSGMQQALARAAGKPLLCLGCGALVDVTSYCTAQGRRLRTIRCRSVAEHPAPCPCPSLDVSTGHLYSASMFAEGSELHPVEECLGGYASGEARRGFGSFGEHLLRAANMAVFLAPQLAPSFRAAVRTEIDKPTFSRDLTFPEVVFSAGLEFIAGVVDLPFDRFARSASGSVLAFRPGPNAVLASSRAALLREWSLPVQLLGRVHGRAKNRHGFAAGPYFGLFVGRAAGAAITCLHFYLHPVVLLGGKVVPSDSNCEGQWLTEEISKFGSSIYKPMSASDANAVLTHHFHALGQRWMPQSLCPDAIVSVKRPEGSRAIFVFEFPGMRNDPAYMLDLAEREAKWRLLEARYTGLFFAIWDDRQRPPPAAIVSGRSR